MLLQRLAATIAAMLAALLFCFPVQAEIQEDKPNEQARKLIPYGDLLADHSSFGTKIQASRDVRGKPFTFYQKEWGVYTNKANKVGKDIKSSIDCKIYLFETNADASASFDNANFGQIGSLDRTVSGWTLGEKFRCIESGQSLQFLRGRVFVKVTVQSYSRDGSTDDTAPARDAALAEAVARGIDYTLSMNLAITHATPAPQIRLSAASDAPSAVVVGDNTWLPAANLRSLGVLVVRNENNSTTLTYQGRVLTLTPLSHKALLGNQEIDLGLPVLQQSQDIVVPIGAVAKALQIPVPISVL